MVSLWIVNCFPLCDIYFWLDYVHQGEVAVESMHITRNLAQYEPCMHIDITLQIHYLIWSTPPIDWADPKFYDRSHSSEPCFCDPNHFGLYQFILYWYSCILENANISFCFHLYTAETLCMLHSGCPTL